MVYCIRTCRETQIHQAKMCNPLKLRKEQARATTKMHRPIGYIHQNALNTEHGMHPSAKLQHAQCDIAWEGTVVTRIVIKGIGRSGPSTLGWGVLSKVGVLALVCLGSIYTSLVTLRLVCVCTLACACLFSGACDLLACLGCFLTMQYNICLTPI